MTYLEALKIVALAIPRAIVKAPRSLGRIFCPGVVFLIGLVAIVVAIGWLGAWSFDAGTRESFGSLTWLFPIGLVIAIWLAAAGIVVSFQHQSPARWDEK